MGRFMTDHYFSVFRRADGWTCLSACAPAPFDVVTTQNSAMYIYAYRSAFD